MGNHAGLTNRVSRGTVCRWAQRMWEQRKELSDLDADVLDALCGLWLTQAPGRPRSGHRPLYALRGGLSGAGANSTDSSIAANIERGF